MLDLSKLLRTHCDELVALLTGLDIQNSCLLKPKFSHLLAIIEHESLVKSVATVCDKRNQIKQDEIIHEIIKKPNENTLATVARTEVDDTDDNKCKHDDSKSESKFIRDDHEPETNFNQNQYDTLDNCNQDDTLCNKLRCEQDDCKPETNRKRFGNLDNKWKNDDCKLRVVKQDDDKPDLSCSRDGTVGKEGERDENDCGQGDRNLGSDCGGVDTVGKECVQDDHKPGRNCDQDDTVNINCKQDDDRPELIEGDLKTMVTGDNINEILRATFEKQNEELMKLLRSQDWWTGKTKSKHYVQDL